jgi:hypothetical protein
MEADIARPAAPIKFYRVRLGCEAAPEIGCGIRSKPILRALEAQSAIVQTRLDRSGTVLAVQWSSELSAADELTILDSAFASEECLCAEPVNDVRVHSALLARFRDGAGWYDGGQLDRLSEEESDIIAARVASRMAAATSLPRTHADSLINALADACLQVLTSEEPGTAETREQRLCAGMLDAGRRHLAKEQFDALRTALADGGHRPREGEG